MDYDKLSAHRCELARSPELWQFDLLSHQRFCQFASDRGVSVFNERTVTGLWRIGMIRADLVRSERRLEAPGLELLSEEDGVFSYCDTRPVERRAEGYGGALSAVRDEPADLELSFHPFRLFVMYHVNRVFRVNTAAHQFLLDADGLVRLAARHRDSLHDWTARDQCAEVFERWNRTAELAIVLEPAAYATVFQSIRWRHPDTEDTIRARLREWKEKARELLGGADEKEINDIRESLCQQAEILDQNKMTHVLLRLMSGHERLKLRDAIGGGILFLCMAEIIRRAAEHALGRNLREEDEMGFGQWMDGARKSIYGTERIFDATPEQRRDFLTSMGLDSGVKARCYTEGDTEYGALTSAVADAGGTEFINLRGQFVERGGRGLSFLGSLKNDMKSHVFSVVVLDQDRADNIRLIRKAAADDAFFGRFFISSPDFEFHNFTLDELVDVLLGVAERDRHEAPPRDEIMKAVAGAGSGRQFFEALKQVGMRDIRKSQSWGVALMNHALQHQEWPNDHPKTGATRTVIEIARLLVRLRNAGYARSLERFRVDPATGELRER